MPSVLWVCYKCRTSMPNPGLCQSCQGQLERYPAAPDAPQSPNPSQPPAPLAGPEEEEGEILRTVKYNNVIPLPPGGAAPAPQGQTLSRSQEILKDTFDDIMSEEDNLQATLRFRGVMKVPLPNKAPEKAKAEVKEESAPASKAPAAKKSPAKKKSRQKAPKAPPPPEGGDNLVGKIVLVAIVSLVVGIGVTTAVLFALKDSL